MADEHESGCSLFELLAKGGQTKYESEYFWRELEYGGQQILDLLAFYDGWRVFSVIGLVRLKLPLKLDEGTYVGRVDIRSSTRESSPSLLARPCELIALRVWTGRIVTSLESPLFKSWSRDSLDGDKNAVQTNFRRKPLASNQS